MNVALSHQSKSGLTCEKIDPAGCPSGQRSQTLQEKGGRVDCSVSSTNLSTNYLPPPPTPPCPPTIPPTPRLAPRSSLLNPWKDSSSIVHSS